jgi:CRISPR-associated endonuclease/helicase Cas3
MNAEPPADSRTTDPLYVLWAKTGHAEDGRRSWHPLICHLIDVAATALALWDRTSPACQRFFATGFGVDGEAAARWVAFFAGLHDVGKASPAFQLQESARGAFAWNLPGRLRAGGLYVRAGHIDSIPHGAITAEVLSSLLVEESALDARLAATIATAVGGHHGTFPAPAASGIDPDAVGQRGWGEVRSRLARELARLVQPPDERRPDRGSVPAAVTLAGFVSVADWIGSNAEFFPHVAWAEEEPRFLDLDAHFRQASRGAAEALRRLGWGDGPVTKDPLPFEDLFPRARPPYPVQRAVAALSARLGSGPSLVLVEAPMGEGKSEAAMYLADGRSRDSGEQGSYFALPTQATTNQMFGRLREFLEARHTDARINLQLLHGQASLSPELDQIRRDLEDPFVPEDVHAGDGVERGRVVAAEWFTHRKRGLLAPFGVGTVDQGLLAVLRTPHVFVRLFGLTGKVVVVDEVHAYDTYMSALLERLLEWLAALGSSVVLLSATLPGSRRRALLKAYATGLGRGPLADDQETTRYPRLAWVTSEGGGAVGCEPARRSIRVLRLVHVEAQKDVAPLVQRLQAALAGGGCAAVICNTVSRAQKVYQALRAALPGLADDGYPRVELFHARYPLEERLERENRTLARFGREGAIVTFGDGHRASVARPDRAVLVATQVVEQSLDLDFDLIGTEHAPVDLVLQRSGRLQRHERPRPVAFAEPELWLLSPSMDGGLPSFGPSAKVYDEHVLLRSWLALCSRDRIEVPSDVEPLVEAVYQRLDPPHDLARGLRDAWRETARKQAETVADEQREAQERWLRRPSYRGALWRLMEDPREEDAPDFHQAHQALTRLAEPSVTLVALYSEAGDARLRPGGPVVDVSRAPTREETRELLLRTFRVTDPRIVFTLLREGEVPPPWRRSPLLRHHRCLRVDREGRAMVGRHVVELDAELGFRVLGQEE